jgi:hypothetical protein
LNKVDDHSLFAWTDPTDNGQTRGLLAPQPSLFEGSRNVIKTSPNSRHLVSRPFSATNVGLCVQFELSPSPFPRGLENTRIYYATFDCSLMARAGIVILLERLFGRGDQFGRVGCRKLEFYARNDAHHGKLETIFVRRNMLRPARPLQSRPYGAWFKTLPSSPSGYRLHTAVTPHLWNDQQCVLRFQYGTVRMESLVFTHETKDSLIVTLGFTQSKDGLRVQVDQVSSKTPSVPELSPFLSEDPRTETVLQTPKWITVLTRRDVVLGGDVFVVELEVNSADGAESSCDMLHVS